MKKFFRIEWEGGDINPTEIVVALKDYYDRRYINRLDVYEISDKVFKEDTCSTTTKHNYQPPICVNCGKEKPKKVEKLDWAGKPILYRGQTDVDLANLIIELKKKQDELIDRGGE